jgi:hypothetical protein
MIFTEKVGRLLSYLHFQEILNKSAKVMRLCGAGKHATGCPKTISGHYFFLGCPILLGGVQKLME